MQLRRLSHKILPKLRVRGLTSSISSTATKRDFFYNKARGYILKPNVETDKAIILIGDHKTHYKRLVGLARKYSEEGPYITLVPEIYKMEMPVEYDDLSTFMKNLNLKQAIQDIKTSADYLRGLYGCHGVGAVGYSVGGGLALCVASHACTPIDLVVNYYGNLEFEIGNVRDVKKPILNHFGNKDQQEYFSDLDAGYHLENAFIESFTKYFSGVYFRYSFYRYKNAGHYFAQNYMPGYNAEDSKLAHTRTMKFLEENLF